MAPPPPPGALASAIAAGDLAAAIKALDLALSEPGAGGGAGRPAVLANRALLHERLGLHRKAVKVRVWVDACASLSSPRTHSHALVVWVGGRAGGGRKKPRERVFLVSPSKLTTLPPPSPPLSSHNRTATPPSPWRPPTRPPP